MPELSVVRLTAGYHAEAPTVIETSLRVSSGEIVAVIGPNGAGKSTLVKAICGLCAVYGGDVQLDGRSVTGLTLSKRVAKGLGYVPQVMNVFPSLTVRENLEMGGYLSPKTVDARVAEVIGLFPDIGDVLGRKAEELSGGQRNMLALARAMMAKPMFLILDEPTAGLAPIYVDAVWRHVASVAGAGVGVLIVEQHARRAVEASHRTCVLVAGQLALEGSASDLLGNDRIAELYLGGGPRPLGDADRSAGSSDAHAPSGAMTS